MDPALHQADPSSQGLHYHVQDITLSETAVVTALGVARGLGVEWHVPLRHITTRIRFEDVQRRPFLPQGGDLHHRNETLVRPADPWLLLHAARGAGDWTLAGRLGVSIPLGRTEPDPFELGRQGLPHQHIQFGTGTWDPVGGLGLGRRVGGLGLSLNTLARLALYENEHGYQAGNRYQAWLSADRPLGGSWRALSSLELVREEAERWQGRRDDEEGNLGRTDLLVSLGVARSVGGLGGVHFAVRVPLLTRAAGAQLDYPVIFTVGLAR